LNCQTQSPSDGESTLPSLCPECRLPWTSGEGKCDHCSRNFSDVERAADPSTAERPRFQFSLGTLLQLMTVAAVQLTMFDVSLLVGILTLLVHVPALWRTLEAIRLSNQVYGHTPLGMRLVYYLYSLFLFLATYVGYLSLQVGLVYAWGAGSQFLVRVTGIAGSRWALSLLSGVAFLMMVFVTGVLAYAFLYWTWPHEKSAAACANPANTGN
jgi:hypothetical protein